MLPEERKLNEAKLNECISNRSLAFARVNNICDKCKQYTVDNLNEFKAYYDMLPEFEQQFSQSQTLINNINASLPTKEQVDIVKCQISFDDMIAAVRSVYFKLKKQEPLSDTEMPPPKIASANTCMLPSIKLPSFDGKIEKWLEFINVYNSLVHNNLNLDSIQKFHYLKSALSNEALSVISGFEIYPENYQLAYDALYSRYQNPRRLASIYLNSILKFKPLASPSLEGLKLFLTTHQTSVNAIKALAIDDLSDFLMFSLAINNLDDHHRRAFENKYSNNVIPKYEQLMEFATQQVRTYELSDYSDKYRSKPVSSKFQNSKQQVLLVNSKSQPIQMPPSNVNSASCCIECKGNHLLCQCAKFKERTIPSRYEFLKVNKRCFNCLGKHFRSLCSSKATCRFCKSNKHHSLLHHENANKISAPGMNSSNVQTSESLTQNASSSINVTPDNSAVSCMLNNNASNSEQILLGTVQILIKSNMGNFVKIRAIIDPGSQISAITQSCVKCLGLKSKPSRLVISGIGQAAALSRGSVRCLLRSRYSTDSFVTEAVILPTITGKLPIAPLSDEIYKRFQNLKLADDNFNIPAPIDFLIGADLYPQILASDLSKPILGNPSAINTVFGWVIIGSIGNNSPPTSATSLFTVASITEDLQRFWEIEEVVSTISPDPLDNIAEQHYVDTHYRDKEGRYVVSLPFKPSSPPIAENRNRAYKCLLNLEKRLKFDPDKSESYSKFMSEYLALGHMSYASNASSYVLPHHCVVKETSSTTKVRVVFNGSDPDSTGVSLNSRLLPGPKLQLDITDIVLSFRCHRVALCGDIKMMYRQISLHPDDRKFQHIFYRSNSDNIVKEVELNTVTYGLTSSSFLAQRTLRQLVIDSDATESPAGKAIFFQTYMDDIITGAKDVPTAVKLRKELQLLLAGGCFELRKWSSNEPQVLADLPPDELESPLVFSIEDSGVKILGLYWDPKQDVFSYFVRPFDDRFTKRTLLSYIAKIYDPMGFITPFSFAMKEIIQKLWLAKLEWDTPMPPVLVTQWKRVIANITCLASLKIPRCIFPHDVMDYRLAGFCDASQTGYAAALYICCRFHTGWSCNLIKAKSKVAPLKSLTIPRLELCAALLLSKLVKSVQTEGTPFFPCDVYLFSDSEIVLSWLYTPPYKLKTFVANRIVNISENVPLAIWCHVSSELNPADLASRGLTPSELMDSRTYQFWFNGPEFLKSELDYWPPPFKLNVVNCDTLPEVKIEVTSCVCETPTRTLSDFIAESNNFNRLRRVVAWMNRFIHNCKVKKGTPRLLSNSLSSSELEYATLTLVRVSQLDYFSDIISSLQSGKAIPLRLRSLTPFIDPVGLVRVGGRLAHSSLEYDSLHPGHDGVPRVAVVRSGSHLFTRAVSTLVPLPEPSI